MEPTLFSTNMGFHFISRWKPPRNHWFQSFFQIGKSLILRMMQVIHAVWLTIIDFIQFIENPSVPDIALYGTGYVPVTSRTALVHTYFMVPDLQK
jgi:hypothetical protein